MILDNTDIKSINDEGYELIENDHIIISKTGRKEHHITVKHTLCGKIYSPRTSSFIKNHQRCTCLRKLSNSVIRSGKDLQKFLDNKFNSRYELISEYLGRKKPIVLKDRLSNDILNIPSVDRVLDNRVKTLKNYYQNANKLQLWQKRIDTACIQKYGFPKFKVLSYDPLNSKASEFRCIKCGKIFKSTFQKVKQTCRCMICENESNKHLTTDDVKQEFYTADSDYVLLDDYKGTHIPMKVLHKSCGNEYYASRTNFLEGKRCPHCKESRNEKQIADYFINHNITFIREYKFSDCKNINALPFDFYLPDYNTLIEYDGEYHYNVIISEGKLCQQKLTDEIKTNYCREHNLKLLRIPYWKSNKISDILDDLITKLGMNISYKEFFEWASKL